MHKVTVSILHYNSSQDTVDCLETLLKSKIDDFEMSVYVLDNGSKEKLDINVSKYKKIGLVVERIETNLGFTGGHNLIYERTRNDGSDLFLLLNNDSLLEMSCIQVLVDEIIPDNIAGVVPKIYFTKGREYHKDRYKQTELGKVIWYAGGKIDWGNVVSTHIGLDDVDAGQFDKKSKITFATGACLLLKRNIINEVGLFDKRYFLYYEDADLSTKLIRKGYDLVYAPKGIVWHNNAGSSGSGSTLHDYYLTRNKLIFGMKYASPKVKALLLKEAGRILLTGRSWQKIAIKDFLIRRLGKGSYMPGK